MDIVKFAYEIDDFYHKCDTKEFAITLVFLFMFLNTVLTHNQMVVANFLLLIFLLLVLIAYKSTSKIRNKNKRSDIIQSDIVDTNYFTENSNKKTINTEITTEENTIEQKSKRTYNISPAPQGTMYTKEAANILGLRPAILIALRKYRKEAQEYDLTTDDSYGPSYIQKQKNATVTYLESEVIRHNTLIKEGALQYITEAQHYERINSHNLKKKNR